MPRAAGGTHFYPRSHVGNDNRKRGNPARRNNFYPRSHVGNDGGGLFDFNALATFLSTFPRRERHELDGFISTLEGFLSTFPRRERPFRVSCGTYHRLDFYPRSHVGNDAFHPQCGTTFNSFLSTFPRRERREGVFSWH